MPYGGTDANATSVVLLVRYGEFEALLTGDARVDA
jgi:beta-lactamase superfamily II metal-dependent hydrolase